MTNTELLITYNASRPSSDPAAYRVSYGVTNMDCHDLRQISDVWNNVVHYCGIYETREAAETAAAEYVR